MKKINVGCQVAFNTLDDAVWFDVIAIDGFVMTIREADTDYAEQRMDMSLVKQIRK